MNKIVRNTTGWLLALQILLHLNPAIADGVIQVSVVKSSSNSYFDQTIETLVNQVDKSTKIDIYELETVLIDPGKLQPSNLIITLGVSATEAMNARLPNKLIVSAYLTAKQLVDLKITSNSHFAVLLDQPLIRYLGFSHLLVNAKSIGIIEQVPRKLTRKQNKLLKNLNFELTQYQFNPSENLLTQVRLLTRQNETLLMLPNQTIYNRDMLKGVLLTAYRNRTPVISYSPSHVKSGALASIYSSPVDIGRHLGDLIGRFHKRNSLPENSPQYAKYFSIKFNHRVAHALGISLPSSDELRMHLNEVQK